MQGERLQKVLAGWGLGSRRAIEQWIAAGEVKVNGAVATLGTRVLPADRIEVRGQPVRQRMEGFTRRVLIYHKPEGELTTRHDPEGRPTVFESLPPIRDGRWITVGRLDFNTSGLLVVTNDGELANRMMHPSRELLRVYAVRVFGELTSDMIKQLKEGVQLEDGMARFESVEDAGGTGMNHWFHVSLREGRNREVRRMFEAIGLPVSRLIRIQYGDLTLPPRLRPGKWNMLTVEEIEKLAKSLDLPVKAPGIEARRDLRKSPLRGAFKTRPGGGAAQAAVTPRKAYVVSAGRAVESEMPAPVRKTDEPRRRAAKAGGYASKPAQRMEDAQNYSRRDAVAAAGGRAKPRRPR